MGLYRDSIDNPKACNSAHVLGRHSTEAPQPSGVTWVQHTSPKESAAPWRVARPSIRSCNGDYCFISCDDGYGGLKCQKENSATPHGA